MKTILLLRHAKSDWDATYDQDHDRPLSKRGRKAAVLMGRALTALDQVPDQIVSSTALRTRDTVDRAANAGGWTSPVVATRRLYEASPSVVLEVVSGLDENVDRVLLAGHETTWSELTESLVGGTRVRFPTAALARIDLEIDRWTEVCFGAGTLVWLLTPRLIEKLR